MSCICLCHNGYAQDTGKAPDHLPEDCVCAKETNGTVRVTVELMHTMEEQMKQKKVLEDALKDLAEFGCRRDANPTNAHTWDFLRWQEWCNAMDAYVRDFAKRALEPTMLCASCKNLTTHSPCTHCGADLSSSPQ